MSDLDANDEGSAIADGWALAERILGARVEIARARGMLRGPLAEATRAPASREAVTRALDRLRTGVTPRGVRGLDARARALLAAEVGGQAGRRWLTEAPLRPGFRAHPGVRATIRAVAVARGLAPAPLGPGNADDVD